MAPTSAGILLYRRRPGGPEVLLGHMGGPFWATKDDGAWSIPKGEHGPDEDPLAVARREFEEDFGSLVPADVLVPLGLAKVISAKVLAVWASRATSTRPRRRAEQHVRDGVAAALGAGAGVPRDQPFGLVRVG